MNTMSPINLNSEELSISISQSITETMMKSDLRISKEMLTRKKENFAIASRIFKTYS